ncbi:hypothetical protein HYY75_04075 [bacterium]|nr:hypothetical protein [bacterium]
MSWKQSLDIFASGLDGWVFRFNRVFIRKKTSALTAKACQGDISFSTFGAEGQSHKLLFDLSFARTRSI